MKKIFTFLALCFALAANAQVDTVPAFKKNPHIPEFKLLQTDSIWFSNKDIPKNKPVVIVYFSPECGHCQLTAQAFAKNMDELKDVFLVWVSAYRYSTDQIKQFAEEYQLNRFSNVRLGKETKYFIPVFYDIKFTPFMAVYDKKGKLLKTYPEGTHPDTLAHLIFPPKS